MSQIEYAVDRVTWLHRNRNLIQGLKFVEEPPVLRFFVGRLVPLESWAAKLVDAYRSDFGEN
jgi:tryptophanase